MIDLRSRPGPDPLLAASAMRASGIVGGIGLVFLVGMYTAFAAGARSLGMTLGFVNDLTGVITLPMALPGVLALHARVRPYAGRPADALLVVGIGAGGAIVVLQVLLVTKALTFEEQIGPVSAAFLVLGAWFVLSGRLAARAGVLPGGTRLGVLAASYAGYPVWAFRIARALEGDAPNIAADAAATSADAGRPAHA
ncbi:MAG TPA: hypothetical protein VGK16_09000 [Candidatus Limnocylindrales bacterium]|jgi:hypothetical protein